MRLTLLFTPPPAVFSPTSPLLRLSSLWPPVSAFLCTIGSVCPVSGGGGGGGGDGVHACAGRTRGEWGVVRDSRRFHSHARVSALPRPLLSQSWRCSLNHSRTAKLSPDAARRGSCHSAVGVSLTWSSAMHRNGETSGTPLEDEGLNMSKNVIELRLFFFSWCGVLTGSANAATYI